jgi:hypothetical protein
MLQMKIFSSIQRRKSLTTTMPCSLYLDLMKRTVTHLVYLDVEYSPITPRGTGRRMLLSAAHKAGLELCAARRVSHEDRLKGWDHSNIPHTMLSMKRLDNLQSCIEQILEDEVPGDLIETGVMRGGAVVFMRAVLKAYGITDRRIWAADSFEGMPTPNPEKYPQDANTMWHTLPVSKEISLDHVKRTIAGYGLLDDQICFLPGWFRDTLPHAPIERLALLRLDGDLYESTMDALENLYPRVSVGGFVIVDDYYLDCCKQAVHDYRQRHNITDEIIDIDGAGAYWRRT